MKEKVEIAKVYSRKNNGVVPTLMKFQNGKLTAFTKKNTHYCRLRNRADEMQLSALLVANGNTYQGLINDTAASELTDSYICVRNKATNKMTVIPIDQVTLNNCIYDKIDPTKLVNLSEEVRKTTLLKKFGSRKASRYINDQEKMQMDIKIVQDELKSIVDEAQNVLSNDPEVIENNEYFNRIRPKINTDAVKVSEVYKMEDVIPNNLLERLEEEAKTVYQTDINQIPIKSEYLKKLVQSIQQSPADNKGLLRLKAIIYMDCLVRLIKSRVKSLKKAELSQISEKVENDVRTRFADPNSGVSGSRTSFSTEKALCHLIVLCLLVDDKHQVDVTILSQELNTPRVKITKYAHIVQALPKSRSSILCLQLPKNVPPLPNKFYKKKKN